jgi:hypothetical protein
MDSFFNTAGYKLKHKDKKTQVLAFQKKMPVVTAELKGANMKAGKFDSFVQNCCRVH